MAHVSPYPAPCAEHGSSSVNLHGHWWLEHSYAGLHNRCHSILHAMQIAHCQARLQRVKVAADQYTEGHDAPNPVWQLADLVVSQLVPTPCHPCRAIQRSVSKQEAEHVSSIQLQRVITMQEMNIAMSAQIYQYPSGVSILSG